MRSPEDLIDIYLKSTKLGCAKLYCFVFWFDCESDDVFFARLQPVIQPFIEKKAARAARASHSSSVCRRARASMGRSLRWSDPRAGNQMICALRSEEALSGRSPPPKHLKWVRVPHGGCWYPAPTGHVDQSGGRIVNTQKPPARSLRPCV